MKLRELLEETTKSIMDKATRRIYQVKSANDHMKEIGYNKKDFKFIVQKYVEIKSYLDIDVIQNIENDLFEFLNEIVYYLKLTGYLKGFKTEEALSIIKPIFTKYLYKDISSEWPLNIEGVKKETKQIKRTATKLPKKEFKLK